MDHIRAWRIEGSPRLCDQNLRSLPNIHCKSYQTDVNHGNINFGSPFLPFSKVSSWKEGKVSVTICTSWIEVPHEFVLR